MSGTIFMMMAANGGVAEQPIDGQTGVWIKAGGVTVSSAMKMQGAVVSSGQSMNIYDRGSAVSGIVSSGGSLVVSSGGIATGGTILGTASISPGGLLESTLLLNPGARINIPRPGGSVNSLTMSGTNWNTLIYQYGGIVTNVEMTRGGWYMFADAVASGITVHSTANVLEVQAGTATDVTAYGLVRTTSTGFIASITAMKGGKLNLMGGTMSQVVVSSGGSLTVSSGGSALAVTSNAGAVVTVAEGGYIEYA